MSNDAGLESPPRERSQSPVRNRSPSPARDEDSKKEGNPKHELTTKPSNVIGVFGLHSSTREEDLERAFGSYGTILNCRLIWDRVTKQSKCFGFITFESEAEATKALEGTAGMKLDGKEIRVDYSKTEKPHDPTPGLYMGHRDHLGDRYGRLSAHRRDDRYSGREDRYRYDDRYRYPRADRYREDRYADDRRRYDADPYYRPPPPSRPYSDRYPAEPYYEERRGRSRSPPPMISPRPYYR